MKRVIALLMVVVMLLLTFTACGGDTEKAERYCKNCGESISEDAAFCEHCGADLEAKPTEEHSEKAEPTVNYSYSDIGMDFSTYCNKYGTPTDIGFSSLQHIPYYVTRKPNQSLYMNSSAYILVENSVVVGIVHYPKTYMKNILPSDDFYSIEPKFAISKDGQRDFCIWKTNNAYVIMDYVASDPDAYYSGYISAYMILTDLGQLEYTQKTISESPANNDNASSYLAELENFLKHNNYSMSDVTYFEKTQLFEEEHYCYKFNDYDSYLYISSKAPYSVYVGAPYSDVSLVWENGEAITFTKKKKRELSEKLYTMSLQEQYNAVLNETYGMYYSEWRELGDLQPDCQEITYLREYNQFYQYKYVNGQAYVYINMTEQGAQQSQWVWAKMDQGYIYFN